MDLNNKRENDLTYEISEILFSLLQKPFMNSSSAWKKIVKELKLLPKCFLGYYHHWSPRVFVLYWLNI
jgi:hypothetical protein